MPEQNLNALLSGGGFSSLLQNPEIAAKLPRIMEALKPVMEEMRSEQAENTPKTEENAAPAAAASTDLTKLLAGASQKGSEKQRSGSARRCALLHALEPYLSDSRREAMEYILKVSTLIDILSEVM